MDYGEKLGAEEPANAYCASVEVYRQFELCVLRKTFNRICCNLALEAEEQRTWGSRLRIPRFGVMRSGVYSGHREVYAPREAMNRWLMERRSVRCMGQIDPLLPSPIGIDYNDESSGTVLENGATLSEHHGARSPWMGATPYRQPSTRGVSHSFVLSAPESQALSHIGVGLVMELLDEFSCPLVGVDSSDIEAVATYCVLEHCRRLLNISQRLTTYQGPRNGRSTSEIMTKKGEGGSAPTQCASCPGLWDPKVDEYEGSAHFQPDSECTNGSRHRGHPPLMARAVVAPANIDVCSPAVLHSLQTLLQLLLGPASFTTFAKLEQASSRGNVSVLATFADSVSAAYATWETAAVDGTKIVRTAGNSGGSVRTSEMKKKDMDGAMFSENESRTQLHWPRFLCDVTLDECRSGLDTAEAITIDQICCQSSVDSAREGIQSTDIARPVALEPQLRAWRRDKTHNLFSKRHIHYLLHRLRPLSWRIFGRSIVLAGEKLRDASNAAAARVEAFAAVRFTRSNNKQVGTEYAIRTHHLAVKHCTCERNDHFVSSYMEKQATSLKEKTPLRAARVTLPGISQDGEQGEELFGMELGAGNIDLDLPLSFGPRRRHYSRKSKVVGSIIWQRGRRFECFSLMDEISDQVLSVSSPDSTQCDIWYEAQDMLPRKFSICGTKLVQLWYRYRSTMGYHDRHHPMGEQNYIRKPHGSASLESVWKCTCGSKGATCQVSTSCYCVESELHRIFDAVPDAQHTAFAVHPVLDDTLTTKIKSVDVAVNENTPDGVTLKLPLAASQELDWRVVRDFIEKTFLLLCRYYSVCGCCGEGRGLSSAVPPQVLEHLRLHLGINCELFASPLNAYFRNYYSMFPDVDCSFGSRGNCFSNCLVRDLCCSDKPSNGCAQCCEWHDSLKEHIQNGGELLESGGPEHATDSLRCDEARAYGGFHGGFHVNPPFDEVVLYRTADFIVKTLNHSMDVMRSRSPYDGITTTRLNRTEKATDTDVPERRLIFVVFLPEWSNGHEVWMDMLVDSGFVRGRGLLQAQQHSYVSGLSHCTSAKRLTVKSPCSTVVLLLMNDEAVEWMSRRSTFDPQKFIDEACFLWKEACREES